jgi:hypothetical protein
MWIWLPFPRSLACQPVEKPPPGWSIAGVTVRAPVTLAPFYPSPPGGTTFMMGTKRRIFRPLPDNISLEDLLPKDNFYRRLEEKLGWVQPVGATR